MRRDLHWRSGAKISYGKARYSPGNLLRRSGSIMTTLDYSVLIIYFLGILAIGAFFARRNKTGSDMFTAGGRSPWWAAGLSGFMTMFSAGTFVVWGGIAFRHGLVAVVINLAYGLAALATGYFVAGKWKKMGVQTPAEFIRLRFGAGALHFYTWSMMFLRMFSVAVALYSLAILLVALMPLAEGNPLRDPATGNLSLTWAIVLFGGIVIVYTMAGGLWAVLMTDVVQFIVLSLAVLFVVPMILLEAGGAREFAINAPPGFFALVSGGYTWFFIAGWCAIHFFIIGADWAFVQRFICVPSPRDARKGTYLFGILYLVSPIIWLLPPMIYRVIDPGAKPEEAYVLACRLVLPAGMIGLMVAAMFSATASMVSSQLNIFAGVLTHDIYRNFRAGKTTAREDIWAGRLFTILLGAALLALALAIPHLGGAETVVITVTSLLVAPLLAPTVWGLLNRKVNSAVVWVPVSICFAVGMVAEFGFREGGFLLHGETMNALGQWIQENKQTKNLLTGVVLPVALILVVQFFSKNTSDGWRRILAVATPGEEGAEPVVANPIARVVVGWSLIVCGLLIAAMVPFNPGDRSILVAFSVIILAIAIFTLRYRLSGAEVRNATSNRTETHRIKTRTRK